MSLISDRIEYLSRRYTPEEIREVTGIPMSVLTSPLLDVYTLDPNPRKNLYLFYNRTVYSDLRNQGATAIEARQYRNYSVARVEARKGVRADLLQKLAEDRLDQYNEYLRKTGRYTSDADTLATLKESIARNMGKSKLPPSHYERDSYATLEHGISDDAN